MRLVRRRNYHKEWGGYKTLCKPTHPGRGLLRDCTTSPINRLQHYLTPIQSLHASKNCSRQAIVSCKSIENCGNINILFDCNCIDINIFVCKLLSRPHYIEYLYKQADFVRKTIEFLESALAVNSYYLVNHSGEKTRQDFSYNFNRDRKNRAFVLSCGLVDMPNQARASLWRCGTNQNFLFNRAALK